MKGIGASRAKRISSSGATAEPPQAKAEQHGSGEAESHAVHPRLASQYPDQAQGGHEHRHRKEALEALHPRPGSGQATTERGNETEQQERQSQTQPEPGKD